MSTNNALLVGLLALSLCVNLLQFVSDSTCVCPAASTSSSSHGSSAAVAVKPCKPCRCPDKSSLIDSGGDHQQQSGDEKQQKQEDPPAEDAKDGNNNNDDGDGAYDGEIGWKLGLARAADKTDNTRYDPADDLAVAKATQAMGGRYARSPVPRGGWKVRIGPNKWMTMDDAVFAYDVWFEETRAFQYMSWLGVYVQQDPADAFVIQQMLWQEKPDLVVEIGTNTGGGAVFYYSIMRNYNPDAKVVTLDVKPCCENWNKRNNHRCEGCITGEKHPLWKDSGNIHFIQGRVTDEATRAKVEPYVKAAKKVIVIEDASHRYPDTLNNIEATHQWVTPGTYLLVQDTKMDRFVAALKKKHGRYKFGPMRSVDEFLKKHSNFVVDRKYEYLLYSQHHRGWLKKKSAE